MINNDKEFQETFKEYLKDCEFENGECHLCDGFPCRDCLLKPINDETGKVCSEVPFQRIKEYEKKIALLKQEISIMSAWKRNREINNKVKDFCKTLRTNSNDVFSCRGIDCNDCLFNDMDNFSEWVRQAKTRGEE